MQFIARGHTFILAGAALLFSQGGVALAQEAPRAPHEQVTYQAPYTISAETGWAGAAFHQDGKLSVSRAVSYADLDLGTQAGVDAFKTRVRDAARDVCRQVDKRSPAPFGVAQQCADTAANDALEKVRVIVASRSGNAKFAALP